ncbi:ABC transporter ATP-binding protein [Marinoscillum furvescens]|uniref:Lipopolysaccharide transport system ATP-binding protein n=1 Tax=Marinoscillum furvescens DSM 4134 TaxID=1122208 RepID=A0A3D9L325_MARFU|nr:ABC transporter ATP-binding protein [Marinoscillum furvescens]RED99547.1 lipopolysaccharide transport system ATP-binding protein [Marinoscillum furvescens DSM 4134]
MSDPIIRVEGISKKYRLGEGKKKVDTFSERIKDALMYPINNFKKIKSLTKFSKEDDASVFWALKDINFEVNQGEVLGIIGHNGAGKSTLLKILSRITEPTEGRITIRGKVSSLLEVGTGFHPELTGRDNIYMNGTILGMRKWEIDKKFDEIVAFSGVEKHIDTPVKFYSSGMQVRLAFSVAAHLEPEILVIDEVLAVGDAEFQRKCLGKMEDVAGAGRTVLFVSHNMGAVEGLCKNGLLLSGGQVKFQSNVKDTIAYYRNLATIDNIDLVNRSDRKGGVDFKFEKVEFNEGNPVLTGKPLTVTIFFNARLDIRNLHVAMTICASFEDRLMVVDNSSQGAPLSVTAGKGKITIELEDLRLLPHKYEINLWAAQSKQVLDYVLGAASLNVQETDIYGTGITLNTKQHGYFASNRCKWEIVG